MQSMHNNILEIRIAGSFVARNYTLCFIKTHLSVFLYNFLVFF